VLVWSPNAFSGRGSPYLEKVYFTPKLWGWNTSPPTYENGFLPPNFLKQDKSLPKTVFKNHSKSQKNHKMENPIVLDSK
jgi:hypothetical protein